MAEPTLSYCGDQVRRYDRERFLTALFAPPAVREDLFTLYAFNLELARVRETVREPIMGQIRFQWWRDALAEMAAGTIVRQHAVAEALSGVLCRHNLPLARLEQLIDGRENDLDPVPPADWPALMVQCRNTAGALTCLATRILGGGPDQDARAEQVGTAHGLVGLMRVVQLRAHHGRVDFPADRLQAAGLAPRMILDGTAREKLAPLVSGILDEARALLAQARRERRNVVTRTLYSAFLVAILAEHGLDRLAAHGNDPLQPGVLRSSPWLVPKLTWAHWSGRW